MLIPDMGMSFCEGTPFLELLKGTPKGQQPFRGGPPNMIPNSLNSRTSKDNTPKALTIEPRVGGGVIPGQSM